MTGRADTVGLFNLMTTDSLLESNVYLYEVGTLRKTARSLKISSLRRPPPLLSRGGCTTCDFFWITTDREAIGTFVDELVALAKTCLPEEPKLKEIMRFG